MKSVGTAFGPSGTGHSSGFVPDPGAVAGTTKFLREDATWVALGTAAFVNTGTSGTTVPLLDGTNIWSGTNTFTTPPKVAGLTLTSFLSPAGNLNLRLLDTLTANRTLDIFLNDGDRWLNLYGGLTVQTGGAFVSGSNTGDVALAGQNYLTIAGQTITAAAVNLGGTHVTGTLGVANGGTGGTTQATARSGLGLGTAATQNTGTSGANVPLMSTANTWSSAQTVMVTDSGTTSVLDVLTVNHESSGTPAANFGVGIKAQMRSSTTTSQDAGRVVWSWNTATHASRASRLTFSVYSTSTEQTLLTLTGGASPTATVAAPTTISFTDAATTTAPDGLTLTHDSSGTPGVGFGVSIRAKLESSTTSGRDAGRLYWGWAKATDGTRTSFAGLSAYNGTAEQIILSITAGATASCSIGGTLSVSSDLSAGGSITGNTVAGNMIATQAQMEAATAGNVIVTPAFVKYAPGVVKAWARIFVSSGLSPSIQAGYNVASVQRTATGAYQINFSTGLSVANNNVVFCTPDNVGGVGNLTPACSGAATGSMSVLFTLGSGTLQDPTNTYFNIMVLGDM